MTLENTFYVLGIIFMVLCMGMLVAIIFAVFYIKQKIDKIHEEIENRIDEVTSIATQTPDVITQGLGALAISAITFGLKKFFNRR